MIGLILPWRWTLTAFMLVKKIFRSQQHAKSSVPKKLSASQHTIPHKQCLRSATAPTTSASARCLVRQQKQQDTPLADLTSCERFANLLLFPSLRSAA